MNNLDTIDFKQKTYTFGNGTFKLKPPYMAIVKKARPITKRMIEIENKVGANIMAYSEEEANESADLQLQLLKLVLEETEQGRLDELNEDNVSIQVANEVFRDFFLMLNR